MDGVPAWVADQPCVTYDRAWYDWLSEAMSKEVRTILQPTRPTGWPCT